MRVANKRTYRPEPTDGRVIPVHRPSALGNPFSHKTGTMAEFVVASREVAVREYELWLRKQIDSGNPRVLEALAEIQECDVLLCFCAPLACHADRVIKVLRELRAEVKKV